MCDRGSVLGGRRRADGVRPDLRRTRVVFHAVVAGIALRGARPRRRSTLRPVDVHGGSMRYRSSTPDRHRRRRACRSVAGREQASGLHTAETFTAFRGRVTAIGAKLMALLHACRADGQRVVGYGATSKSTTTINFFGITPDLVEFISDTTPAKHGTFSPARTSPCGRTRNSPPAIRIGRCCSCGITPPKCGPRNRRSPAAADDGSSTCRTFRSCDA